MKPIRGQLVIAVLLGLSMIVLFRQEAASLQDETQILSAQAKEFWEARLKEDWAKLYRYLPDDEKKELSLEEYVSGKGKHSPYKLLSYEVGKVEVDGHYGWVEMNNSMKPGRIGDAPPVNTKFWQVWLKGKENWFPLPHAFAHLAPKLPPSQRPAFEEATLKKRIEEAWGAAERMDWEAVYSYFTPKYRENNSLDDFVQKAKIHLYLSHNVEWTEVAGRRGRARVVFTSRLNDPSLTKLQPQQNTVIEQWIQQDGTWYREADVNQQVPAVQPE